MLLSVGKVGKNGTSRSIESRGVTSTIQKPGFLLTVTYDILQRPGSHERRTVRTFRTFQPSPGSLTTKPSFTMLRRSRQSCRRAGNLHLRQLQSNVERNFYFYWCRPIGAEHGTFRLLVAEFPTANWSLPLSYFDLIEEIGHTRVYFIELCGSAWKSLDPNDWQEICLALRYSRCSSFAVGDECLSKSQLLVVYDTVRPKALHFHGLIGSDAWKILAACPCLQYLDLQRGLKFDSISEAQTIVDTLLNLTSLRGLSLRIACPNRSALQLLLKSLENNVQLEHIAVSFDDTSLACFPECANIADFLDFCGRLNQTRRAALDRQRIQLRRKFQARDCQEIDAVVVILKDWYQSSTQILQHLLPVTPSSSFTSVGGSGVGCGERLCKTKA
jgi:hypothetical protein